MAFANSHQELQFAASAGCDRCSFGSHLRMYLHLVAAHEFLPTIRTTLKSIAGTRREELRNAVYWWTTIFLSVYANFPQWVFCFINSKFQCARTSNSSCKEIIPPLNVLHSQNFILFFLFIVGNLFFFSWLSSLLSNSSIYVIILYTATFSASVPLRESFSSTYVQHIMFFC